jgi:hypothetical protein
MGKSMIVLCVLLAGCQSVAEIREYGTKSTFHSSLNAIDTSHCIAQVIDDNRLGRTSSIRPLIGTQGYEVRAQSWDQVMLIAEVRPSKDGADVQQWLKRYTLVALDEDVAEGCGKR